MIFVCPLTNQRFLRKKLQKCTEKLFEEDKYISEYSKVMVSSDNISTLDTVMKLVVS